MGKKTSSEQNRSGDARSKALTATGAYLSPLKAYPWYQTQCGVHVRRRGRRSPTEDPPPRADEVAVVLVKFHEWGDGANHSICLFHAW
jgi:hypothetical protein